MQYSVHLIEEARGDFKKLDNSQKLQVAKQLKTLESNPYKGKRLGKKYGINLTGYYKLYAAKKQVRIVYMVKESRIMVEVISIGMREDFAVYKEAFKRVKNKS
ncbi:MAG: addiction module toxin RelE [bacterium]|nr:addiction module toxin RelE [bacterium]